MQNNWREQGLERDLNAMDVNKGREGDRKCYVCGKWGYIAKNYWQRKGKEEKVVETLQELAKDNGEQ